MPSFVEIQSLTKEISHHAKVLTNGQTARRATEKHPLHPLRIVGGCIKKTRKRKIENRVLMWSLQWLGWVACLHVLALGTGLKGTRCENSNCSYKFENRRSIAYRNSACCKGSCFRLPIQEALSFVFVAVRSTLPRRHYRTQYNTHMI